MSESFLRVLGGLWGVFQLHFPDLESLKRVWEVTGGSLDVSWRYLKGLWETSGKSLGDFWEVAERFLEGRTSRKFLGGPGFEK